MIFVYFLLDIQTNFLNNLFFNLKISSIRLLNNFEHPNLYIINYAQSYNYYLIELEIEWGCDLVIQSVQTLIIHKQ